MQLFKINTIILIFISLNHLYAQESISKNYNYLQVKNPNVFNAIELIITFETLNVYGSISDERCYLIDYNYHYKNLNEIDTFIKISSIYLIDFNNSLIDSITGVFCYMNHLIFVKKQLFNFFYSTDMSLNLKFSPKESEFCDNDDSQTKWIFKLNNGKLEYINSTGVPFINIYGSQIQIIEEIPEEFPKYK